MKFFERMQLGKKVKRTGIVLLVIAVFLTSLHLFVVYRARQILNYIVMEASDGQYKIKAKKVKFRYNPLSINATGLVLLPVDTTQSNTYYSATSDSVYLEVTKLWPLITSKNFTLGNVHIVHPVITVYDTDTTPVVHKPLNLAISDIQHALVSTLSAFNVNKCRIDNAGLEYKQNKTSARPLSVNHIFLDIKNLHAVKANERNDSVEDFKADIRLFVDKPFIQLPDTSTDVYLENLLLDTKKGVFTVNRFNLFQRNNVGTVDSINLSNINLRHFNWPRWLKEGIIEIDSLQAYNGSTFFDFSDKEIFTLKDNNKQRKRRPIKIPMLLHSVEINKINYSLRTGSPSGPLTIQLNGDSLGVSELSLSKDSVHPLQVGNLAFRVTGYTNNYDNNSNQSQFEKLIIDHNDLTLVNYHRALNGKKNNSTSSITIPSLRVINFSLDDLLESKLTADKLILDDPQLLIDIHQSEKKRDADAIVASIAGSLQPSLDIKQLSIHNAAIVLLPKQKTSGTITIENLNTEIDARQLLDSKSVMDIISSATALSTSGFLVTGDNINLEVQRSKLNSANNGVYLQRISGTIGRQLQIDLQGVSISDKKGKFDITKLQSIALDNVEIDAGKISVDANHSLREGATRKKAPAFNISNIHTGPLMFEWMNGDKKLRINDIKLNGRNIEIENGKAAWDAVDLTTGSASFQSSLNILTASNLSAKQPGNVTAFNLHYSPLQKSAITDISIPVLSVQTTLKNTKFQSLNAEQVTAHNPSIAITINKEYTEKRALQMPDFSIDKLIIDQPVFTFNIKDTGNEKIIKTDKGTIVLRHVNSNKLSRTLTMDSMQLKLINPILQTADALRSPERVMMNAHAIVFNTSANTLKAFIDSAELTNLSLGFNEKNATTINSASAGFTNYQFSSNDSLTFPYLVKHVNWWSNAASIKQQSKQFTLTVYEPYVAANKSFFSFDSLSLIPILSKDSFWLSTAVEKDYNTLRLGYTQLRNWKLSGTEKDRSLTADYLVTDGVNLLTEKDKTHGPDTVTYRPLLANSFKKIPLKISFDTVQITNSYVKHTLLPEKSKRQAMIYFSGINGYLYNVKNFNYAPTDSLQFRVGAQIMGQGDLLMGFKQSYTDTMQGFALRARMGRMDLSALNPLLMPLVSVKIDRGVADSMLLVVGANDFVAYGFMDMRYRNLRLSLLKKGEKKYFLSSFFNWIINAAVHSKDDSKTNPLYQERLRNKGIYNYWSKIAISGLLTNLGVKREKKQVRKYKKAIKQHDIPTVSNSLL